MFARGPCTCSSAMNRPTLPPDPAALAWIAKQLPDALDSGRFASVPTVSDPARATDESPVEVDHVVALLRERLYGAISCLATLAVLIGVGLLVVGIKTIAH